MIKHAQIHRIESAEQFPEYAYAQGWTDGMPAWGLAPVLRNSLRPW